MTSQLLRYAATTIESDSANLANAVVERDGGGNINVSDVNCQGVVPTAAVWLTKTGVLTGSVTVDANRKGVIGHKPFRGDASP